MQLPADSMRATLTAWTRCEAKPFQQSVFALHLVLPSATERRRDSEGLEGMVELMSTGIFPLALQG